MNKALEGAGETGKANIKATKKKVTPTVDVANIANLARLSLSEEEKAKAAEDMNSIVAFANSLSELDTEGIEASAYVVPLKNVMREDVCESNFDREELLSNAKTKADGYVTVPRVVE